MTNNPDKKELTALQFFANWIAPHSKKKGLQFQATHSKTAFVMKIIKKKS